MPVDFRERCEKMQKFKFDLRKKMTPAEKVFKKTLSSHKLKYQFQRPFHSANFRCIVDFIFKTDMAKIVVEIDGGYHASIEQKRKDEYRTKWLSEKRKCRIIRFTNEEVLENIDGCVNALAIFYLKSVGKIENPSDNYLIFNTLKNIIK